MKVYFFKQTHYISYKSNQWNQITKVWNAVKNLVDSKILKHAVKFGLFKDLKDN